MDLVVDPAPDGVKLPGTGYTSGSLQDNITISNDKGLIGGHLKYTTGMVTMYPDDRLKQEGNFIALWLHEIGDPYVNYDKIEAKIVDGAEEKELEVSDEGYICFRVNDRATTKLVVTVTIGDQTYDAEYKLTGLTVDSYGWNILKGTNLTGEDLYQWGEYVASDDIYSDDSNKKFSIVLGSEDNGVKSAYSMVNGEIDSDTIENEWIKSQFTFTSTSGFSDIGNCLIATSAIPLKPNTKYTYSYYEKGTRCPPMTVRINRIDQHSGSWPFVKNCFEPVSYNDHEILEDKYTRHEISFTTDEDISEYVFRVGFYVAEESNSQDYTWSIAGLKLEEGDHATGWDDYWSGDNLLLDTDQPDLNNHNPNISQGLYRQIYSNIPSMISNIEFIRDDDLPETGLLINNKMVINTTVQNSGNYINIYFNHLDSKVDLGVKTGDPVTLSYYIKPHASTYTGEIVLVRVGLSSSKDMGSTILLNSLDANKWNKIVCTVINDENLDLSSGNLVLSYRNIKPAKNMTIEICGMKLEKGAHVTDYRIAPTDFNINYLLNSEVNLTNDEYCITNKFVELISDFNNDTSHMQPLVITMDADINPRRDHFSTYFVLGPSEGGPVNSRGSISPLTYLSLEPRLEKVKSNSYYNYILYGRVPNIDTFEDGRYFGSIFNGLDVYVSPRSERDGANSTIRKIKLELGRYPTKWVDGTGDSAYVPSDEEDDDLEVT